MSQALSIKAENQVELAVNGFRAAATACGLKKNGAPDLALIVADPPANAAGVFTKNRLAAAPVRCCRQNLASGEMVEAILVNSGNANAATGQAGWEACLATTQAAATQLGCQPQQVMPCSTGVIGKVLDAGKITAALPGLVDGLAPEGLEAAAGAIMTTDAFRKKARAQARIGGRTVTVCGLAKGAGMIRPDMATMLAFVLTDAAASSEALRKVVSLAAEQSFNRATVDGDMSTNDTLLLLANGAAGGPELGPDDPELAALTTAVTQVCQELAQMMVADGEGSGRLVRVEVEGAPNAGQAQAYAYAIAHSPLVKTAFASGDPYWGRVLSAAAAEAGRQAWTFEPERTRVWFGEHLVAQGGMLAGPDAEEQARPTTQSERFTVRLDLGLGKGSWWLWTSDLDHGYIDLNVSYRS